MLKKKFVIECFIGFLVLGFFHFLFSGISNAAIHYVSPTGAASWANSTNISTPCSISTAFSNAQAGDTIYFRGGTYPAGQSSGVTPVFYPANSGSKGNPIIFKAFQGETPIINGMVRPKATGTAGAGTTNTTLVDSTKDFNALGIVDWDVLRTANTTKGGAAVHHVVDSHTIALYMGTHNTLREFQEGDAYEIGADGTQVLGTSPLGRDYITFDGFTIQANDGTEMAKIRLDGPRSRRSIGNIVKNITFIGPAVKKIVHGSNKELLRVENNSYTQVQNCKFSRLHNVKEGVNNTNTLNTGAIKTYHSDHLIIENCEIYDVATGIFLKSDTDDSVIRYNFIHGNRNGIIITPDMIAMMTDRVKIYHNVVVNCSDMTSNVGNLISIQGGDAGTHGNDIEIYNNTLYNSNRGAAGLGLTESGHGYSFYNNIVVALKNYSLTTSDRGATYRNYLKEVDHNQWGPTWRKIWIGANYRNHFYTSLASWQASNELESPIDVGCGSNQHPGCGDLASDPKFVNASGKLNELSDFALASDSPCKRAGRGGADMGANIDLVGILAR